MIPELGIIEGYFGVPWTHAERKDVLARLRPLGYSFYHYAPKADAFLRRRWRERHPDAALAELADLASHCRSLGMRFGIGLSPYELYRDYSGPAKAEFLAKLRALDDDRPRRPRDPVRRHARRRVRPCREGSRHRPCGDGGHARDPDRDVPDLLLGRPDARRRLRRTARGLPRGPRPQARSARRRLLDRGGNLHPRVQPRPPGSRGGRPAAQADPVGQLPRQRRSPHVPLPAPARDSRGARARSHPTSPRTRSTPPCNPT